MVHVVMCHQYRTERILVKSVVRKYLLKASQTHACIDYNGMFA